MAKTVNSNVFYRFLEWLMWIMYLNLLWIIASVLGLVVFGVFPATMALAATIREWCVSRYDISFNRTFFRAYKNGFIKANIIGLILMMVGYILFIDYQWILQNAGVFQVLFLIMLFVIAIIYGITSLYIFPVAVHFDLTLRQTFKHAMVIGIFSPLLTISMLIGLFLLQYVWRFIPGLLPVIGMSLSFYIITRGCIIAFERFESRQKSLLNKEMTKGEKNHA